MYSKYERPIVSANIFYYDIEYKRETVNKVIEILKKYNMCFPEKIYADKLTKGKYISVEDSVDTLLTEAYTEKDVFGIDMASGNSRQVDDYWRISWDFTYYKNSKLVGACSMMPWNVLTIQSTYGRLQEEITYKSFISCVKELIAVLKPFYASIDDLNNKVELMKNAREPHFVQERIQEIYWGNYFGEMHCDNFGMEVLLNLPIESVERLGEGVFFTLSKSVFEYNSKEVIVARKKIKQILNLNIKKHLL